MGGGNSEEAWLAQGRLHVDLWLRRIDQVWISCLTSRVRIPSRFYYHPLSFNRLRLCGRLRRRLLKLNRRRSWLRQKARSRSTPSRLEHSHPRFRRFRLRIYRCGAAASYRFGVGKGRSREPAITLAGYEAKPILSTSSIPAALSASSSSMLVLQMPTIRACVDWPT